MTKTKYQIHPLAAAFPALSGQELNELVDDIRRHGVREPIVLFEGKILDGRNRSTAASLAGIEDVPTIEFDPVKAGCSAEDFVISMNLIRRHLTPSQKSALAHEFMERMPRAAVNHHGKRETAADEWEDITAELHRGLPVRSSGRPAPAPASVPAPAPAPRQQIIAPRGEPIRTEHEAEMERIVAAHGGAIDTRTEFEREREAELEREYERRIEDPKRDRPAPKERRQRAVIAEKFGVSEGLIDAARRVKARSPELYESVKEGNVSVQQALKEAMIKTGEVAPPKRGVLSLESRIRELVAVTERTGGKITIGEYKFTVKHKAKKCTGSLQ